MSSEIISLKETNNNLNKEIEELKKKVKNDNNKVYKYKYELMIKKIIIKK